jgi:hypothetical protein
MKKNMSEYNTVFVVVENEMDGIRVIVFENVDEAVEHCADSDCGECSIYERVIN